jgi:hypothetical protein
MIRTGNICVFEAALGDCIIYGSHKTAVASKLWGNATIAAFKKEKTRKEIIL